MTVPPLNGLLHDFGDDWQIEREPGGQWIAIERPQVQYIRHYLADTPEQLRQLLENDQELRR